MAKHTQHWTDESDSSLLVTYTYSPGDTTHYAGPNRSYTWEQSEQAEAERDKLCSSKTMGCAPVPAGGCDCLVSIILSAAQKNQNLLLRDEQELYPVCLVRRVVWLGDLIYGAEEEGNSWLGNLMPF